MFTHQPNLLSNLQERYKVVFTGLGKLENPYKIHLDTTVKPVVQPPRRVAVAIHDLLKEKLDQTVADGVITPVTEATDRVSNMVVVRKI